MAAIKESTLTVPAELVRRTCGISMDMGGSVFKAAYRTAENVIEANDPKAEIGHLTLLSVSKERFEEAVDFLSKRAVVAENRSSNLVYTTGLGCSTQRKVIAKLLQVRVESVSEFECFVKAFHYLAARLPRHDLLEPFDAEAAAEPLAMAQKCAEAFKAMMKESNSFTSEIVTNGTGEDSMEDFYGLAKDSSLPLAEAEEDVYPCVLAMCGSGLGFMQINADGTFAVVDGSPSGGRDFLGLGSILTGAKTFDELLDLAVKGDSKGVHVYGEELFAGCTGPTTGSENGQEEEEEEEESSMYAQLVNMEGQLCYSFGKCPGRKLSEFRKEDVAKGLLEKFVVDIVQMISLVSRLAGVRRVFFAGSFLNHKFIRGLATAEFIKRNLFIEQCGQKPLKFDFFKPGPQMGAIGALIKHFETFAANDDCANNNHVQQQQ